jgi:antitoxin FitA
MKIAIELAESQAEKLRGEASRLGVHPDELATAAVVDLLNHQATEFDAAAEYVLSKNQELYKRLS